MSVLSLVKEAWRAAGGCKWAVGLWWCSVDASNWRHSFPEALNGHRKVADWSAPAPAFLAWSAQVQCYHHPSFFWALHHHGHRVFSALFILSHKSCASLLQQEMLCGDVSVRKYQVFVISESIVTSKGGYLCDPNNRTWTESHPRKSKVLVLCYVSSFYFSEADNHPSGALTGVHPGQDYVHCSGWRKPLVLFWSITATSLGTFSLASNTVGM